MNCGECMHGTFVHYPIEQYRPWRFLEVTFRLFSIDQSRPRDFLLEYPMVREYRGRWKPI